MKKRERLEAAINGDVVDRIPVALWRHWPGDDQRPDDLAAVHIRFQREFDWDFVKVSPSSSYCIRDWGVEDRWEGHIEGTRTYTRRPVEHPDDWLGLKVLDPTEGALAQQLQCLGVLNKEFGEDVPFIQTIFNPLAQLKNLSGEEKLILHMRQNAGQIHHALQTVADTTVRFIQEAKERGISGIYYAVQHANYSRMSEAEYQVFGRPYDLQVLSAASDLWLNVLHVHDPNAMFHLTADYPVQVINWHDRDSSPGLAAGLKKTKSAASGGVSQWALHDESPEIALDQARDALVQTGGKRWILGTGCVMMVTTPIGNVHKLRTLADELKPV